MLCIKIGYFNACNEFYYILIHLIKKLIYKLSKPYVPLYLPTTFTESLTYNIRTFQLVDIMSTSEFVFDSLMLQRLKLQLISIGALTRQEFFSLKIGINEQYSSLIVIELYDNCRNCFVPDNLRSPFSPMT